MKSKKELNKDSTIENSPYTEKTFMEVKYKSICGSKE